MTNHKTTKKLLSFCLIIIIIASTIPVVFAATETLTASNVQQWPTISYKNADGKMYYGQTLEEGLTINDDEIVLDANNNQVAGHFEFVDPTLKQSYATNAKANLIFVPDETDTYTGFKKNRSSVTYNVDKTTLELVDENNPPMAASTIAEGGVLSSIEIIGGQVKNPYNATESNAAAAYWTWTNPDEIVTESGEYEAKIQTISSYNEFTVMIYVEVEKAQKATTLKTMPKVKFDYNPKLTWGTYEFAGASAVVYGTDDEVPGTFSIIDSWAHIVPGAGDYEVEVVFTPDDAENYIGFTTSVPVTINTVPVSFIDSEGNFVVDGFVFEAEPGTLMRDIQSYLMAYLNYPPQSVISVEDKNSYAENDRTYKLTVIHDNPNYTGSEVYFTVVFKDVELTPVIASAGYNEYKVDCGSYRPDGTFTVSCNGEEIAEVKAGQPFDCVVYTDEGGTYEITAKYNPVENDYFIVSDASYSITVNPARNIKTVSGMHFTVNGSQTYNAIRTGDVIELTYNMPEFAYYVVKDGNGKTVTLDGVDLASKKIKFTMPDFDLSFSVKTPAQLEQEEATANCDHLCHSDNPLIQIIWKLLHILFRLFNVQQYCDCGITHYDAPIFG